MTEEAFRGILKSKMNLKVGEREDMKRQTENKLKQIK